MAIWPGAFAITSFFISAVVVHRIRRRNLARGHVDHPGGRKDQAEAVPYGGGEALILGFTLPIIGGAFAVILGLVPTWLDLVEHEAGLKSVFPRLAAITGLAALLGFMGRLDDQRGLPILPRFVAQMIAAGCIAALGTRFSLYLPEGMPQLFATIIVIVFLTNAFNFIDNMDGLAPGAGLASSLGIALFALYDGQLFAAAFAFTLAGAFGGVLIVNRSPARIYLGDEGTLFGGFLLATAAAIVSFRSETTTASPQFLTFLVPFFLLGIPMIDGVFVCLRRILSGRSPWTPGRDHLSHVLARRIGKVHAVRVMVAVAFLSAAVGILLGGIELSRILGAALMSFAAVAVFFFLGREAAG